MLHRGPLPGGNPAPDPDTRALAAKLKAYARPDRNQSIAQLLTTSAAFGLLWLGMWLMVERTYWLTLLLAVPTAAFLVRLFIIQHDCGHGSFFRSRTANDLVGRVIGVITLTPYDYWRRAHAVHHATSGNLDRRGVGDISTLTVREYRGLSRWRRLAYRLYRHPLVFLGVGPTYLFVLKHRLPLELPPTQKRLWAGVLATNAAIAGLTVAMSLAVGVVDLVKIQLPVTLLASSMGVWLFFVQHQFEDTYWRREEDWDFYAAALRGSSYYDLPQALHWLTAGIGLHHIHHLCSRIPNYRLKHCLDRFPELRQVKRLGMLDSLKCARLALWDEEAGRMVRFDGRAARTAARGEPG